jgi:hypothetical protein
MDKVDTAAVADMKLVSDFLRLGVRHKPHGGQYPKRGRKPGYRAIFFKNLCVTGFRSEIATIDRVFPEARGSCRRWLKCLIMEVSLEAVNDVRDAK